ncbi:uncharacterized protein BO95DRAFT_443044 [Aspergillus brunneoviolaceus CBS 621.78]|uniref:Uncharacterized protein n=1 Tax=Aspergillus brunneoviolaceus CBS 621.78 TaxID=1450534 RepID=A0ACD1G7X7_9EURO|nr:hypothetical protein BO95DRAFT_443044 [Aspergillus brunneoviolaceus CBS 621.78]RAH45389.1 hypothetical protein BO95DRAFT_443044 [Aspergillus brunneoviolaceus CBS 621.78]
MTRRAEGEAKRRANIGQETSSLRNYGGWADSIKSWGLTAGDSGWVYYFEGDSDLTLESSALLLALLLFLLFFLVLLLLCSALGAVLFCSVDSRLCLSFLFPYGAVH